MTCPCKKCDHRTSECHGNCEDYKPWKEEMEAERLKRNKGMQADCVLHDGRRRRNRVWK